MARRIADDKKVAAELTLGMVTRVGSPHSVPAALETPDLVKKYAAKMVKNSCSSPKNDELRNHPSLPEEIVTKISSKS